MYLYCDIVKVGDEVLRVKCTDVELPLDEETKKTLVSMHEYLEHGYDDEFVKTHDIHPGVGLASPQIGKPKRMLAIMAYDEKGAFHDYIMVNPKVLSYSVDMTYLESGEGCLSVPETHKGYIHRHRKIKVQTYLYDYKHDKLTLETLQLKGYLSIVFQHEFDHLNGVLFFDHINKADPFFVPENSKPVKFKGSEEETDNELEK